MSVKSVSIASVELDPYHQRAQYRLLKEISSGTEKNAPATRIYSKSYDRKERIKRFCIAIFLTLITCGGLFSSRFKFRRTWGKIIAGRALIHVKITSTAPTITIDKPSVIRATWKSPPPPKRNVDQSLLEEAKKLVNQNYFLIRNRHKPDDNFHFFKGKHCTVFSHLQFSGIIFKIMESGQARESKKNLDIARDIVKNKSLSTCFIPKGEIIDLDSENLGTLFVMEKAPGSTNSYKCQEISERAFEKFSDNPESQKKWERFFLDAAEFILSTGYWDTSWNNILIDEQRGFSFIDFERTEPTLSNKETGIERLLNLAPIEFYDAIIKKASEHGVEIKNVSAQQEKRKADLELRSRLRAWHRSHQVSSATKVLNCEKAITDMEKMITEKLDSHLNNSSTDTMKNLVTLRSIYWQPFALRCDMNFQQKDDFNATLQLLQEKKIICTWTTKEMMQPELIGYNIYF